MPAANPSTGVTEVDRLIGGVLPGDNLVWEVDSAAPVERFVSNFLSVCETEQFELVYVSFNRSPQTVVKTYANAMSDGRLTLVDCFSSGKGQNDKMFLDFYRSEGRDSLCRAVRVETPENPEQLHEQLASIASEVGPEARYVFDSLTGMFDLWSEEEAVLRFFGHLCPRLHVQNSIAYWLLEEDAHSERFLAKLRHITQVVLGIAVSQGVRTLTVRKAANRDCSEIGMPRRFDMRNGQLVLSPESREDRELGMLTRMGEAVGTALEPNAFFQQTLQVLAEELGMIRGTIVLLDRASGNLRIVGANGLSPEERARGKYKIGEGVTGHVVKTGVPQVVADISKDPRFLDRTNTRSTDWAHPIAFICVPLKIDHEVVGALSVDRPLANQALLDKDLRLVTIVSSTVSHVLKINRLITVEKEQILARDDGLLQDLRSRYRVDNVVGQSRAIQQVLATAATAAKSRASILITGETGTGKELIANVVHYNSQRATGPLVKVNCSALPESLLESELFGHVKGAFTSAVEDRKGRFELAEGGTLFLDEVAEMSPRIQVKLLRVLQEREFEPIGSPKTIHVDVRVVTATNKDLSKETREGRFREDLYYRLNVIRIHLPSLRERLEDIPLLVNHFLEEYNRENDKNVTKISPEVLDRLLAYRWPGNVRELENCIERSVVMSPGEALMAGLLPSEVSSSRESVVSESSEVLFEEKDTDIRLATERFCERAADLGGVREKLINAVEETIIRKALSEKITRQELARKLGMSRTTLRKRMDQLGILP